MQRLCLFDIDGTLLHVPEDVAFATAFQDLYGPGLDLSYSPTMTVSDVGYVDVVLTRVLGRSPSEAEIHALLGRFVEMLGGLTARGEVEVRPVAGAPAFVRALRPRHAVAVSTGCVEGSARVKLRQLGLDDQFPCGGFSFRERHRSEIVSRAIAAAEESYGMRFAPSEVVLFGDGPWDLDSAERIGVRFIGINESEGGRARLTALGAAHVFADFLEVDALEALVRA